MAKVIEIEKPKKEIKLLEDPLPMWRYDADGFPHRYGKILFIHDLVKKLNEVIEVVNEIINDPRF